MVTIVKNGSGITISGYSPNGAESVSDQTISIPTSVNVSVSGYVVTMAISAGKTYTYAFTQQVNGLNRISTINGTDVKALTASQVKAFLQGAITTGFTGTVGIMAQNTEMMAITTSATGANFVPFASMPCNALNIINLTGTIIEYKVSGTGNDVTMWVADQSAYLQTAITNANQVSIRRYDQNGTQKELRCQAITA